VLKCRLVANMSGGKYVLKATKTVSVVQQKYTLNFFGNKKEFNL